MSIFWWMYLVVLTLSKIWTLNIFELLLFSYLFCVGKEYESDRLIF